MPSQAITVSISEQTLCLESDGERYRYPISTAVNGTGQLNGSGCTPLGKHYIRAKIGEGLTKNSVLVGRRWTGEVLTPELYRSAPERDWILSRILWLSGLEIGHNRLGQVDTMRRFIYIHGTPDEANLGKPASHGCVRMSSADVIELYDLVQLGTIVTIKE